MGEICTNLRIVAEGDIRLVEDRVEVLRAQQDIMLAALINEDAEDTCQIGVTAHSIKDDRTGQELNCYITLLLSRDEVHALHQYLGFILSTKLV